MRLGLFGGTFDPPHAGHLLMAEAAKEQSGLDRVIFVPAAQPVHKPAPGASAADRLRMLRLAVRGERRFAVSDWEIRQARPVYTVETLAYFQRRHPAARLHFIIGSDSLRDIPRWRTGRSLLKKARFLVIERPEAPWRRIPAGLRREVTKIDAPLVSLSSHAIRERVRRGVSIRYQVPLSVETYIRRRRLYRQS